MYLVYSKYTRPLHRRLISRPNTYSSMSCDPMNIPTRASTPLSARRSWPAGSRISAVEGQQDRFSWLRRLQVTEFVNLRLRDPPYSRKASAVPPRTQDLEARSARVCPHLVTPVGTLFRSPCQPKIPWLSSSVSIKYRRALLPSTRFHFAPRCGEHALLRRTCISLVFREDMT